MFSLTIVAQGLENAPLPSLKSDGSIEAIDIKSLTLMSGNNYHRGKAMAQLKLHLSLSSLEVLLGDITIAEKRWLNGSTEFSQCSMGVPSQLPSLKSDGSIEAEGVISVKNNPELVLPSLKSDGSIEAPHLVQYLPYFETLPSLKSDGSIEAKARQLRHYQGCCQLPSLKSDGSIEALFLQCSHPFLYFITIAEKRWLNGSKSALFFSKHSHQILPSLKSDGSIEAGYIVTNKRGKIYITIAEKRWLNGSDRKQASVKWTDHHYHRGKAMAQLKRLDSSSISSV